MNIDDKHISPFQAEKLRKMTNISAEIIWNKTTSTDTMQSLLNVCEDFWKNYFVRFVNVRQMKIGDSIMSCSALDVSFRATYRRYTTIEK